MVFFLTNHKKKIMITLVMPPLKTVVVEEDLEDLADLVAQIFQIYLKIFLETLVEVEEEVLEKAQIEVQI